jgi:hypothetical protein
MRRTCALAIAVSLCSAACSGDDSGSPSAEVTPGAGQLAAPRSRPPEIVSARITPEAPSADQPLSVAARVIDPEGDRLRIRADWYVNRQIYATDAGLELEHPGLRRGDEVYAVLRADDGESEAVFQVPAVRIGNSPPRVVSLRVLPDPPTANDTLMAEARVEDSEGDGYDVHYRWLRNGAPIPDANGPTLDPGNARRGDEMRVEAWASDSDEGAVHRSATFTMANARPSIESTPPMNVAAAARYEYQIKATDPDKDRPLRYRLVRGPDQMSVDLVTGLVEWEVPQSANGRFAIELGVKDPHGGEARQSYELEFRWETVPANASETADVEE